MSEPHDGETAQALPLNMSQTAWSELEKYLFREPAVAVATFFDENSDDGIGDQFFELQTRIIKSTGQLRSWLESLPDSVCPPGSLGHEYGESYPRQQIAISDVNGQTLNLQTGEWEA